MTNIETRKITSESKKHQRDQVPRELINKISNLSQEVKRLEKSPEVNVKYIRQKNQEIKELEVKYYKEMEGKKVNKETFYCAVCRGRCKGMEKGYFH